MNMTSKSMNNPLLADPEAAYPPPEPVQLVYDGVVVIELGASLFF